MIINTFSKNFTILFCFIFLTSCSFIEKLSDKDKLKLEGKRKEVFNNVYAENINLPNPNDNSIIKKKQDQHSVLAKTSKINMNSYGDNVGNINFSWPTTIDKKNQMRNSFISKSVKISNSYQLSYTSLPIIKDDKIFTIDSKGIILASDLNNNKILWENSFFLTTHNNIKSKQKYLKDYIGNSKKEYLNGAMSISKDDSVLYATGASNIIIALNSENGEVIWKKEISSNTKSIPLLINNLVIVQALNNTIYALNKTNGEILWVYTDILDEDARIILSSKILKLENDLILIQDTNGNIVFINALNGEEIYRLEQQNYEAKIQTKNIPVTFFPVKSEDVIYLITEDSSIMAINYKLSRVIWKKYFNVNKPFWIAGNFIYIVNDNAQFLAVDKNTGEIIFIHNLEFPNPSNVINESNIKTLFSSPVVAGDYVAIVSYDGTLMLFDPIDGKLVKTKKIIERSTLPPLIYKDSFFIMSKEGEVKRYKIKNTN